MTKALGRHVTFGLFALFVAACSGGNVDPDDRFRTDFDDLMQCSANLPDPVEFESLEDEDDVRPSPPSIGADVPVTYFGPPPTSVNRNLVGPLTLLTAGVFNETEGTTTLPLYEGRLTDHSGKLIWYIVTDTTDEGNAKALGLNHAPKLNFSDAYGTAAVRHGTYGESPGWETILFFDRGTVDFAPVRSVTPGPAPNYFPPVAGQPGGVGDAEYSPLVRITNAGDHVYNAPMVAFDVDEDMLNAYCETDVDEKGRQYIHDSVRRICPADGTVTLELVPGFSFGRPVLYLSTDSNDMITAALEGAVQAPGLDGVAVGADDSLFSAVERLFATTNGPVNNIPGQINPQRQGFNSALRGEGGPLNVLGGIPTVATDYSPLWDVNIGEWTQEAVDRGYRSRVTEEFQILGLVQRGFMTGPGGTPYGSSGVIVNCPIVHRFL